MKFFLKKIFFKLRDVILVLIKIKNFIKFNLIPRPEKENQKLEDCYDMFIKDELNKSYNKFKNNFLSAVFISSKEINSFALNRSFANFESVDVDGFFLEFGVFDGTSINKFAEKLGTKTIYGFDSFVGMREDWEGTGITKGFFDLKGKFPKVKKNVQLIKGWVQDTLIDFLHKKNPNIHFVHMDLDTYDSTKFVLQKLKPYLQKGSILLFNEFYNFPGWSVGECKALEDVFEENEFKIIAFSKHGWEAVVEIN